MERVPPTELHGDLPMHDAMMQAIPGGSPSQGSGKPPARSSLILGTVILIVSFAASVWWGVRQQRAASLEARTERVQLAGSLLGDRLQCLLSEGDLPGARRLVIASAASSHLSICRVTVGPGQVLADLDPHRINVEALPTTLPDDAGNVAGGEARDADVATFPLSIAGRGTAVLELTASPAPSDARFVDAPSQVGIAGVGTLLALLLVCRRLGPHVKTMSVIREALIAVSRGDRSTERLAVAEAFGPEAVAWNDVLAEVRLSRERKVLERGTHTAGSDRRSSGGALEAACDAMVDGLILVDPSGRVKFANGAAGVYFKSRRDAITGRPIAELINDPEVLQAVESIVSGTATGHIKVEVRQGGGTGGEGNTAEGVLRFSVRPVRNGDGAAAMVIIEDITQRRVADEARNSFVSQVAHELRTPLTNIRLHVESAIDAGQGDAALRERCLSVISSESLRLERVVGEMLSVSEIEAGSMRLRRDDVRLDALMQECRSEFEAQAAAKQIAMSFDLPPKLPVLQGDRDKIALALHNLVGNAIKYTGDGGKVTVTVEERKGTLTIEVADTGIGIGVEEAEKVFDRFYRAKDARISKITGTGLGLTLAREVARLHGGDVVVESELDKGSMFTLTLPGGGEA